VNVSSFTTVLSVVNLASFSYCTANLGGAIYIQTTGIKLMDVKLSSNGALECGSDIYHFSSETSSYYTTTGSVSDFCSDSPGDVFLIGEDRNVFNHLFLSMCVPNAYYVSYVGSFLFSSFSFFFTFLFFWYVCL
jgi:hypothetical protein